MLSDSQLASLSTSFSYSSADPEDVPQVEPSWIPNAQGSVSSRFQNFLVNVLVDQLTSTTSGLVGERKVGAHSPLFNYSIDEAKDAAVRYLRASGAAEHSAIAESAVQKIQCVVRPVKYALTPGAEVNVSAGNSRYYRVDDGLALALQKDLAGSMPWVEFGSKVGGCRTIRLLGLGESVPHAWAHALKFGVYLIRHREVQKTGNAPVPKEQSTEALSKQVERILASVPHDRKYQAIHRYGNNLVKALHLVELQAPPKA